MKKIKVHYMGKRLKDVYPYATKWQVFKYKVVRIVRFTLAGIAATAIVVTTIMASYHFGGKFNPDTVYAEKVVDKSQDYYNERIEALKYDVVNKLSQCESGGAKDPDGLIIFDSNKKASIGRLQFQVSTVQYYYKVLYEKTITQKEAIEIATDADKAKSLAKDIMFTSKKQANDWYNCAIKLDLNKEIQIIKKL